jgi:3-dehydroquinate synthase
VGAVRVRVGETAYPVIVEPGAVSRVGTLIRERLETARVAVVADRRVAALHGEALERGLDGAGLAVIARVEVPPGERSKSLTRTQALYRALLEAGADRWTPVVALGGGVIGDLTGFAAATLFRGMPVVHVPSTVIAQVDSSVGGKTGVNFAGGKNLIGAFHQPALVVADPRLLGTLSPRDYRAGLAEAVKIGVTLRPDLLASLETEARRILDRDPELLVETVTACVEAKGEVVGRDEREEDVRAVLNYGHALEAESLGRLRHGEAVAAGMNAAAWLGEAMGVSDPAVRSRQNALLARLGLKLTRPEADKKTITRKLKLDKKVRDSKSRVVLTLQIGGASVWPRVPDGLLKEAVELVTS